MKTEIVPKVMSNYAIQRLNNRISHYRIIKIKVAQMRIGIAIGKRRYINSALSFL